MYKTEFVTAEEHAEYLKSKQPYQPHALLDYLKFEVIKENGINFMGKLLYRHCSGYSFYVSPFTYLQESDTRSISPIADFLTKKKPFYVTYGTMFFRIQAITSDEQGVLIFHFEHHDVASLN